MLEFAELDDNGNWYGIVQRNARSALHRARDRHGLYLRTWYGTKASRAKAPKGFTPGPAASAWATCTCRHLTRSGMPPAVTCVPRDSIASLAPAPGYGVVPAASNAISAIVIPRMSPTA